MPQPRFKVDRVVVVEYECLSCGRESGSMTQGDARLWKEKHIQDHSLRGE